MSHSAFHFKVACIAPWISWCLWQAYEYWQDHPCNRNTELVNRRTRKAPESFCLDLTPSFGVAHTAGTTGAQRRVDALSESVCEAGSSLGLWGADCFWQRMLSVHELAQGVKDLTYTWLHRDADGLVSRRSDFCRPVHVMHSVTQGRASWQRATTYRGLLDRKTAYSLENSTLHSAARLKPLSRYLRVWRNRAGRGSKTGMTNLFFLVIPHLGLVTTQPATRYFMGGATLRGKSPY